MAFPNSRNNDLRPLRRDAGRQVADCFDTDLLELLATLAMRNALYRHQARQLSVRPDAQHDSAR
jgi:hypothetical protein